MLFKIKSINFKYVFRVLLSITIYLMFGYLKYKTNLVYFYLLNVILKHKSKSKFGYWSPSYL